MALDILNDNWGPYTHTDVENALKTYLADLDRRIKQAIQSGNVGLEDLSHEIRTLLDKANNALQSGDIAAWAKAQNKPGYTASEITGIEGFQNLLAKLQDMDQKIQAAAASGGVNPDDEMSSTSENVVQNKVIKAYVDAAVLTLQNALNALMNGQSVTDAIDTFNEIKAFLDGIDTDDPTLYNQLLTLSNDITALRTALNQKQDTLTFDDAPTAGSNNPVKSGGIKTAIDAKADSATTYNKTEVDSAINNKLTEVTVTEISDAADVIVIDDADLAFIDEDGNIAMQVREGHVETQNFDSRQVGLNAAAIQQLQSQIENMDGGGGDSKVDVKNDVDAALDITDDNGNVVLRVTTEGHIQTKEFDSSEQGGSSGQSGQDEMAYFLATKMVPQCICHGRDGFSGYRANTIPYYVKGYTQGFRFFECDVITCADGAICCHLNVNGYTVYKKDDPTQTAVAISKDGILQWSAATLASDYTWTASTYTDGALTALGVPIATMQDIIKRVCHDFRCPLYMQVQDNNQTTRVSARNYAASLGVGLYLFTEVANLGSHADKAGNHAFVVGSAADVNSLANTYKTDNNNIIFTVINNATSYIDRFTDAQLKAFADAAHDNGCYIGCYTITNTTADKERAMRLFQNGFDFATTNGVPMSSL